MTPSDTSSAAQRLFIRVTRDTLPRVADRYPFIYLERGRLEVDDSSIKWLDAGGECIRLPAATKNRALVLEVRDGAHEDGDEIWTLNDVPLCFGPRKRYRDRQVTLFLPEKAASVPAA